MTMHPLAAKAVPLNFILLRNYPIFLQLQLEEALLRADDRNWCLINIGSPEAIVMGISGKTETMVDMEMQVKCPVPIIRRFSGGGTVFVDNNTLFATWICNADHAGVPCYPAKVHGWAAAFYHSALPSVGMKLRENDYAIGDLKCGGNAQYFRKQRWLHHSSFLWDYKPENMRYLRMPPKMPSYREGRRHDQFLCRLSDFLPHKDEFEKQLIRALESCFDMQKVGLEEALQIAEREHRKATHLIL